MSYSLDNMRHQPKSFSQTAENNKNKKCYNRKGWTVLFKRREPKSGAFSFFGTPCLGGFLDLLDERHQSVNLSS